MDAFQKGRVCCGREVERRSRAACAAQTLEKRVEARCIFRMLWSGAVIAVMGVENDFENVTLLSERLDIGTSFIGAVSAAHVREVFLVGGGRGFLVA